MFTLKELENLSSGVYLEHEVINSLLWVIIKYFYNY